ncbi:metalloregulator ArsR/SmtB family transcription factor [Amycolatopsis carbonis]|uniref:Metalloregulator ArsR/SmtB family transcription factor n=1 Tax=Amycolatopsis carbonis TaxID=715471 RepID=A0A9Y2I9Q7_9PSEU|nr:metalloregulator ArsR/SmtB family transcription factor [Amycolatopsis sp. 2-15]WIX75604.1 metalloregulator ArsR/SmtB family transcription factor [Amycolatopsis sp. 2-15]
MPDSTPPPGACCAPLAEAPLSAEDAADLATGFKALGDPVRLRLLSLICTSDDGARVSDLAAAFQVSGPTISHHLKLLREAGLVDDAERRGTSIHYRPRSEALNVLADRLAAPPTHG